MARVCCTVTGKNGDALWQMATARAIAEQEGARVAVGLMAGQAALAPLLREQVYVKEVFVVPGWVAEGSPHGDVPRVAPSGDWQKDYDKILSLGYHQHPAMTRWNLMEAVARWAQVELPEADFPFLSVDDDRDGIFPAVIEGKRVVAVGFNDNDIERKASWLRRIEEAMDSQYCFVDVRFTSWLTAARRIKSCGRFLGDMSALHVLAAGLGVRPVVFETDRGRLDPWARSRMDLVLPFAGSAEIDAALASPCVALMRGWWQ